MRQTMLGILALSVAMLLSLSVQRGSVATKVQLIDNELETMAAGVALEVLDYIGTRDFDAATAGGNDVENESELTAKPFSTGNTYQNADDIDDFHEMQTHTISEFDLDFTIEATVDYVHEDDPEQSSSSQTFAKKVTVTIDNEHLRNPIQVAHVYTYP